MADSAKHIDDLVRAAVSWGAKQMTTETDACKPKPATCPTCGSKGERYYSSDGGKSGWHLYVERIQDGGCPENCKPCPNPYHAPEPCQGCGKPLTDSTNLLIRGEDGVEHPWHQGCYKCPTCAGGKDKPLWRWKRGPSGQTEKGGRKIGDWHQEDADYPDGQHHECDVTDCAECTDPFHAQGSEWRCASPCMTRNPANYVVCQHCKLPRPEQGSGDAAGSESPAGVAPSDAALLRSPESPISAEAKKAASDCEDVVDDCAYAHHFEPIIQRALDAATATLKADNAVLFAWIRKRMIGTCWDLDIQHWYCICSSKKWKAGEPELHIKGCVLLRNPGTGHLTEDDKLKAEFAAAIQRQL